MEINNKTYIKGAILILGLLVSLMICSAASAANVNSVNHYSYKLNSNNTGKLHVNTYSNSKTYYHKNTTNIPTYYDLRKLGRVSPVKNQDFSSTCWAFAVMGSLESCLLPKEKWSFSENNLKNLCSNSYPFGFDRSYDGAGCWEMATAYFTRYTGPVTTAMDPYNDFSGTSPTDLKPVKHVQQTVIIPARNSSGKINNNQLKNAVIKYGAIYTLMYYNDIYYNPLKDSYYNKDASAEYNHAVCIVGWNDSYSKNNFPGGAPGNGAFIVKNSWGTDWGDKGYFYVSYYDKLFANSDDNVVFMNAEPTSNYDNIYQYDPLGYVGRYGFNSDVAWFSNIFTANGNENLKAASFYVLKPNASYNLYVYVDPVGNNPTSGKLVTVKRGEIATAGYITIQLKNLIPLLKDHKFSVVVRLTTPNLEFPVTIEYPLEFYSSKAKALPGESYVSRNGKIWMDMTSLVSNANVCLKAFTMGKPADLLITKNLTTNGQYVTFIIKVKNNGPGHAVNVLVKDKLKDGLTFLKYEATQGFYNPITGIWYIGTLDNGSVCTLILKCIKKMGDKFSNHAEVISSTYDPNLLNNLATVEGQKDVQNKKFTTGKFIPMKKTGLPVIPMLIALILIFMGYTTKRYLE